MRIPTLTHLKRVGRGIGRLACGLTVALVAAVAAPAAASSIEGDYITPQSWITGPSIGWDGTDINVVLINGAGQPFTAEFAPPAALSVNALLNLRLLPSREFIFTWNPAVCGTEIYIYRIPPGGTGSLIPVIEGPCIPNQISQVGFFDRPDLSSQRKAFVVSTPTLETQEIMWIDMDAGTWAFSPNSFNRPVGAVTLSPSGTAAFVQHDTNDISVTDYASVNLCAPNLGQTSATALANLDEAVFARVVRTRIESGTPVYDVEAFHQPSSGPEVIDATFTLDDCECVTGPTTGACCFNDGSCMDGLTFDACDAMAGSVSWTSGATCADVVCDPGLQMGACCFTDGSCMVMTQDECNMMGGTSFLAGLGCATNPCPQPQPLLSVSATGPATGYTGGPLDYTITYANNGSAAAQNVLIRARTPTGGVLESVQDGGTVNGSFIEWTLGTVGVGQSGSVNFTALAFCSSTEVVFDDYTIRATNAFGVTPGTDVVTTPIDSESTDPVNVTVTQTTMNATPVRPGDVIGYRVTIENTSPDSRPELKTRVTPLSGAAFDSMVDAGGGTWMPGPGFGFTWESAFAPGETISYEFTIRVNDCLSGSLRRTGLGQFSVQIACGPSVGQAPRQEIEVRGDLISSATILPSPDVGTVDANDGLLGGANFLPVRAGATIDLQFTLENDSPDPQAGVDVSMPLPAALIPVGDPPFATPTDAATTWDGATRTARWMGDLAPGQVVTVTMTAMLDPATTECRAFATFTGGTPSCGQAVNDSITLMIVPEQPTDPYLVGLDAFQSLWQFEPNVDQGPRRMFCQVVEVVTGMGLAPNGDIYVAGLPTFVFNPHTLDFTFLDIIFSDFSGAGGAFADDVAFNTMDGMAYFAGVTSNGEGGVWQYDPATRTLTSWLTTPTPSRFNSVVVDPEGRLVLVGGGGVHRIDPLAPTPALETLATPFSFDPGGSLGDTEGMTSATDISIDGDGDYLLMFSKSWSSTPAPGQFQVATLWGLGRYDRASDVLSEISDQVSYWSVHFPSDTNPPPPAFLDPFFSTDLLNGDMTAGPNGDVYFGRGNQVQLLALNRACELSGRLVGFSVDLGAADMEFTQPTLGRGGDVDMNGIVDFADLNFVLNQWGNAASPGTAEDLNGDGSVDQDDLNIVLDTWGLACP